MKKRIVSVALILALCLNMLPTGVFAAETDETKICRHHPEHTAECGYVEEVQGSPCTHEHTEACYEFVTECIHEHTDECYSDAPSPTPGEGGDESDTEQTDPSEKEDDESDAEQTDPSEEEGGESDLKKDDQEDTEGSNESETEQNASAEMLSAASEKRVFSESDPDQDRSLNCTHECSEESGCIVKKLHCTHEHDDACGYVESVPGHPCEYVCRICPLQELIDALPNKITEENREDVIKSLDEILEKYEALTEEEQEQVDLSRYEKLRGLLEEDEKGETPYYLFVLHSLDLDGDLYCGTELMELSGDDLKEEYDLHEIVMEKEGMEAVGASYYDEESGGLEESWTVSLSDFTEAGDPEDGSDYYAVQAVIEYGVADGYTAVVPEEVSPADDPYGIMPLIGLTGGNIEDITFEPANIVTVTVNYMYSPTGGLSGMPAAAPREYQIAVTKDTDAVLENVSIPNVAGGYQNLDGFRIVLDSKPLNEFLVNPELANEMSTNPDPDKIKNALENDLFTIDTNKDVYYDKSGHNANNPEKGNPYSNAYNQAWDEARSITTSDYTATASSGSGSQNLGATPLTDPKLTVTIPAARVNQILEALKTDPDSETVKDALTVTVYYRRNAGEYTVNHWVPYLSAAEQSGKPQKEVNGVTYWNVYPETKQGRIGAMTNAISGMDQMDRTGVEEWLADGGFDFRPYVTQGFAQQIVASGGTTEVDIYYDSASEYRIIFDTSDTYIPRVSVNANDTLVFDYDAGNGNGGNGSLTVRNSSGEAYPDQGAAADYQNPARTGYRFSGWRYEVKENSGIPDAYKDATDGKWYVDIDSNNSEFEIEVDENKTTVIVLASGDANTVKAIHLYPIWEEASANVRVVFWTEDLGGAEKDVDVDLSNQPSGSSYIQNLGRAYLSGTPDTVGSSFSNAGSFTFTATTGQELNLSVNDSGQSVSLATTTAGTFQVTGDTVSGNLGQIINEMFQKRMADVTPTAGDAVNSSIFYHPYAVMGADNNNFTVAADGSTVINVRYARNVYSLDFTYYGTVNSNTSIATNAKGYSGLNNPENYDAQRQSVASNLQNAWDRVTNVNSLTVPRKVTVKAKYGADLREVWPRTYSETIATTYGSGNNRSRTPTFTSWATTAGGYNQRFKNDDRQEPTIMGVYSAMDVDVIADPTDSRTTHHMYAYWCPSLAPSHYRFNHCFEIPDLTWDELINAADKQTYNLRDKEVTGIGLHRDPQPSDERADTIYLVPVNGTLGDKFADYADVLLKVTPGNGSYTFGEASENGTHYVVRRYESKNNVAQKERVYALARQVDAISTNTVKNQNPSARLHMERANDIPDHATNASDEAGRSTYDDPDETDEARRNNQIGTAENPYDLFFYYDRERMTITYMVPARDSDSGEYTLGTKEVPYGASLSRYDVQLDGNPSSAGNNGTPDNKRYSNDPKFADFWEAAGTGNTGEGLQNGYARTAPNSAADGKGIWTFHGWSLDRALSQSADFTGTMSGNLRLFANWEEPKYQVTFELAGGVLADGTTGPIVESNLLANQGYTSNENADIPRPTQNGHTLTGWKWFEEDGVTEVSDFTFETPITRNMVAVAQWTTYDVKAYKYKVWYLTNDTDPVTRKTGEGWIDAQESGMVEPDDTLGGTVNTTNYNKVLGCQFITGDYPEGTNLLLGAESFAGYIPYNGNASILLGDPNPSETADNTQYVAYFYYNKARMKKYTIQFQPVKISNGEVDGDVLAGITQTGETDQAYFTPSDENFKALRDAGYQLVQMNADGTVVMENGKPKAAHNVAELKAFIDAVNSEFAGKDDGETMTVTFKVMPIPYTIDYWVGTLVNGADRREIKADMSGEISLNTLAGRMQKALNDLEGDEISVAVPAGKNPTAYDVSYFRNGSSFTLQAPVYVQNPEPGKQAEWWKFTGWNLGEGTSANTTRAVAGEYTTLEVEHSVGDLIFLANWERAEAGLTVQNRVITNTGLTAIPDEEFEYTLTLPAGTDPTSLFAYKTDQTGAITEFPIPAGWDGKFSLKHGETMSFGGLTGAYTVAQTKTGNLFDDTQKNYFKLIQVTADGTVVGNVAADGSETGAVISGSHGGTLGGGNLLDALIFTNEYMATVDLDTDPDQADNQGFPVTKYLLEEDADGNRTRRTFFGGNNYEFTIRAGAQSTAGTPVPNAIALRSTAGDESLSGGFDSVRFTKTGTYTYVIRESRPSGTGVPGVSYDPTRYRVTVEVTADDTDPSSLKTTITRVESRTTEDNSGGTDVGWTVIAGGAGDLEGSIEFNNVYNTTQINRTFQPTKVLTGRDTPLAAGEFTFTLTPAGSVNITQEQAQAYHNASTDEAKLNYLQGLDNNNLFTADNAQPMPGNVGADHKVTNGESGAVLINPITYTSDHMGNQRYGKVYKYTISEDIPAGAVDGKYNGMVYDTDTRTLYVYVHLHTTDGALAALGDPDTLVYADVLGDRDTTFTNTYETAPVTVDVGGDGDPEAGVLGIPLVKQLRGRNFKAGDSFTFTLTADTPVDAPLPKNAAGEDVSQVTVTPTGSNRVNVLFGQLTFTQEGTYVYTLQEQPGDAEKMTYDTEPKTLTITVTDDGEGRLTAMANPGRLTWTNTYKDDSKKDPDKDPDKNPENDPGSDTGSDSGSGSGSDSGSGAAGSDPAAVSAEGGAGGALPQTGMLWWPVWILVLLGVVMLGIGIVRKRSSRGEHEE